MRSNEVDVLYSVKKLLEIDGIDTSSANGHLFPFRPSSAFANNLLSSYTSVYTFYRHTSVYVGKRQVLCTKLASD